MSVLPPLAQSSMWWTSLQVAGDVAAGRRAAAILGVEDDALVGGGDAARPAKIQGPAGVFVEHGEVVVGLLCHADAGRAWAVRCRFP